MLHTRSTLPLVKRTIVPWHSRACGFDELVCRCQASLFIAAEVLGEEGVNPRGEAVVHLIRWLLAASVVAVSEFSGADCVCVCRTDVQ